MFFIYYSDVYYKPSCSRYGARRTGIGFKHCVNTYMASRVNDRLGIVLPSVGLINHGDMVLTSFKAYNQEKVSLILHGGGLALNIIVLKCEAEEREPDIPLIISLVVNSAILSTNILYMLYKTVLRTKDNLCLMEK